MVANDVNDAGAHEGDGERGAGVERLWEAATLEGPAREGGQRRNRGISHGTGNP